MKVAEFRPEGARYCTIILLPLQGGAEYRLPWARYYALTGRPQVKITYLHDTVSKKG